jgi:hypothetical protein
LAPVPTVAAAHLGDDDNDSIITEDAVDVRTAKPPPAVAAAAPNIHQPAIASQPLVVLPSEPAPAATPEPDATATDQATQSEPLLGATGDSSAPLISLLRRQLRVAQRTAADATRRADAADALTLAAQQGRDALAAEAARLRHELEQARESAAAQQRAIADAAKAEVATHSGSEEALRRELTELRALRDAEAQVCDWRRV